MIKCGILKFFSHVSNLTPILPNYFVINSKLLGWPMACPTALVGYSDGYGFWIVFMGLDLSSVVSMVGYGDFCTILGSNGSFVNGQWLRPIPSFAS